MKKIVTAPYDNSNSFTYGNKRHGSMTTSSYETRGVLTTHSDQRVVGSNAKLFADLELRENKIPQNTQVFGKPSVLVSTKGMVNGQLCFNSLKNMTVKEFLELASRN